MNAPVIPVIPMTPVLPVASLSSPEKRALLARLLRRHGAAASPLSHGQKALWFLHQAAPESAAYHVAFSARIRSRLDVAALRRAMQALADRHEQLRATFRMRDGEPVQEIAGSHPVSLATADAAGWSEAELRARVAAAYRTPFDLARGPLFRADLFTRADDDHVLLITVHHIVYDGWSLWLTLDELQRLYAAEAAGVPARLPPPARTYRDFIRQEENRLAGPEGERLWQYWKARLAGELPPLDLPLDHARPLARTFHGASCRLALGRDLADAVRKLAQAEGATPFMILLAAFQVFLHRHTGQDDILVGSPTAGREDSGFAGVIGYFVNPVVLRADLSANPSFRAFLGQVRETALAAMAHQGFPYPLLVERLRPRRDPSIAPVLQAFFALHKSQHATGLTDSVGGEAPRRFDWGGLTLEHYDLPQQEGQFDLELELLDTGAALTGAFKYNADLFEPDTVARMAESFAVLLRGIVGDPGVTVGELPLLSEAERHRILRAGMPAAPASPEPPACLHVLFERQARATPDAVAVTHEGRALTYAALDARADRLARRLRALGVGPEALVGLCAERSPDMIVGMLGILKAGGAYLPLDPASPRERTAFILADSGATVLLTQEALAADLPAGSATVLRLDADDVAPGAGDDDAPPDADADDADGTPAATPGHLAYVIYTSGSTGKPKGVEVTHANVARLFTATRPWFHFGPDDVWTLFHSFAFDFSVWEIWGALLHGGRLVVVPQATTRAPAEFVALCAAEGVTVLNQTPSAFREFIRAEAACGASETLALRLVIFGGEALDPRGLRPWFARHGDATPRLVNMYGITETTVHVTYRPLIMADADGTRSTIGVPIPDLGLHLLDRHLQPVPDGVAGEIHVGGAGVARGYLRRPALTGARFIADPFSGDPAARLYRSGDLARRLRNGDIEYLGRGDTQVKIRGFRIELGEIEAALGGHPALEAAAVTVREHCGDKRLVAYVVPRRGGAPPAVPVLRRFLSERLPGYMVPGSFVTLDGLPLTGNGKLDLRALPPPGETGRDPSQALVPPRDDTERRLAVIWEDVLGAGPVGMRDDFFELGGHSLLAVSLMARIESAFGRTLPIAALFRHPTIERLAEELSRDGEDTAWSPLVPIRGGGPLAPFFCVAGGGGNVLYFHALARRMSGDRPFHGLQAAGLDGTREPLGEVSEIAAMNLRAIRDVQPEGPYLLGGHCFGGWVAFEMAQQLLRQGQAVELVAILDSPAPRPQAPALGGGDADEAAWLARLGAILTESSGIEFGIDAEAMRRLDAEARLGHFRDRMQVAGLLPPGAGTSHVRGFLNVFIANSRARYAPPGDARPVPLAIFRAGEFHPDYDYSAADDPGRSLAESTLGWGGFAQGRAEVRVVPGNHITMMSEPHVAALAASLSACLPRPARLAAE